MFLQKKKMFSIVLKGNMRVITILKLVFMSQNDEYILVINIYLTSMIQAWNNKRMSALWTQKLKGT